MNYKGPERRRSPRHRVLESFSMFVSLPKKGDHRLPLHDVSQHGVGFDLDLEGEILPPFQVTIGEELDIQLYLNQSLFVPIKVKVARIESEKSARRIGAELLERGSKPSAAFQAIVKLIDHLEEFAPS